MAKRKIEKEENWIVWGSASFVTPTNPTITAQAPRQQQHIANSHPIS